MSTTKGNISSLPEELVIASYIKGLYTALYLSIFISGVLGNVMVILAVCINKNMINSPNIYLVNLAISDLLVILFCLPVSIIDIYSNEIWYLGKFCCKLIPYVQYSMITVSILTILVISLERYVVICWNYKSSYCNLSPLRFIPLIWGIAFATLIPILKFPKFAQLSYVNGDLKSICYMQLTVPWKKAFYYSYISIFFLAPFFILVFFYTKISIILNFNRFKSLPNVQNNAKFSKNLSRRRQLTKILISMVILFFVCYTPYHSFAIWTMYATPQSVQALGLNAYTHVVSFSRVMFYINSSLNPILYTILSEKFRAAFYNLIMGRRNKSSHMNTKYRADKQTKPLTTKCSSF